MNNTYLPEPLGSNSSYHFGGCFVLWFAAILFIDCYACDGLICHIIEVNIEQMQKTVSGSLISLNQKQKYTSFKTILWRSNASCHYEIVLLYSDFYRLFSYIVVIYFYKCYTLICSTEYSWDGTKSLILFQNCTQYC